MGRIRAGSRRCQQVRAGAPAGSLTANAGLAAVSELCGRLGVIEALDAAAGPVKQRDRGLGAGELRTGIGHGLLPEVLAGRGNCPPPPDLRLLSPAPHPGPRPVRPNRRKAPQTANPAPTPGLSACPLPGILAHQDHLQRQGSAHRAIRGVGSDRCLARLAHRAAIRSPAICS